MNISISVEGRGSHPHLWQYNHIYRNSEVLSREKDRPLKLLKNFYFRVLYFILGLFVVSGSFLLLLLGLFFGFLFCFVFSFLDEKQTLIDQRVLLL